MAARDVAFVAVAGPGGAAGASATVGLYAGMAPAELERLLRAALRLAPTPPIAGLVVVPQRRKQRRKPAQANGVARDAAASRVVPLSLACRAPELLQAVRVADHLSRMLARLSNF